MPEPKIHRLHRLRSHRCTREARRKHKIEWILRTQHFSRWPQAKRCQTVFLRRLDAAIETFRRNEIFTLVKSACGAHPNEWMGNFRQRSISLWIRIQLLSADATVRSEATKAMMTLTRCSTFERRKHTRNSHNRSLDKLETENGF